MAIGQGFHAKPSPTLGSLPAGLKCHPLLFKGRVQQSLSAFTQAPVEVLRGLRKATSLLLKRSRTAGELPVEFDGKPFIVCGRSIRQVYVIKPEPGHCSWQDFETVDVYESPHSYFVHTVRVFVKGHILSKFKPC